MKLLVHKKDKAPSNGAGPLGHALQKSPICILRFSLQNLIKFRKEDSKYFIRNGHCEFSVLAISPQFCDNVIGTIDQSPK